MRSAVTVSLVPEARGGPFVFWDNLEDAFIRAARLGFDAVEIFPPEADAIDLKTTEGLVERHGVAVAALGTGGGWVRERLTLTNSDPKVRKEARAFIRAVIDRAGALGAPAIIGSMQGRWEAGVDRDQALTWLAESLTDLAEDAHTQNVPLLYEPLNRYETNLFNRLGDTAAWLKTLPTKNVRILADLFHMNLEEADMAAALHDAGSLVGHVHFADSNRRAIGLGHTDVSPVIAALRELEYRGYLSAEILPLPDAQTAAERTIAAFRSALGRS